MEEKSQCTATDEQSIRRYADMVYRLAYAETRSRSDADDVFQEVFFRYLRAKPVFESEEHRKAWLLRVTVNCAKKLRGSLFRRRTVPLDDQIPFQAPEERLLDEALEKLPPRDRRLLHLFYYEDYAVSEIGKLLDTRESTVRTQLTRARRRLGALLKKEEGFYVSGYLPFDE